MVGHGGSSAGSYLANPTSPIPSHCASIVVTSTLRVNQSNVTCAYQYTGSGWQDHTLTYTRSLPHHSHPSSHHSCHTGYWGEYIGSLCDNDASQLDTSRLPLEEIEKDNTVRQAVQIITKGEKRAEDSYKGPYKYITMEMIQFILFWNHKW